ncbi:hypothetical protein NDU88_011002 [Pleurodeles waltl]|uniref:Uncharacterized protein n=1 Tax=Pleurodeles waltl TaxID=8319 RepID=A0AAV7QXK1_PLEWA|nr:hypothetical protein NDU88_011002 [Pleurodeles waltl]
MATSEPSSVRQLAAGRGEKRSLLRNRGESGAWIRGLRQEYEPRPRGAERPVIEGRASRELTVRGVPPSVLAAATTGGGERLSPQSPALANSSCSPFCLGGVEDGTKTRFGKAMTQNRGEARHWRRASFLLGSRGWRVL